MTITEFLLARIAEDEATAREVDAELREDVARGSYIKGREPDLDALHSPLEHIDGSMDRPAVDISPQRVLAECASKRHMLMMAQRVFFPSPLRVKPFWDGQRAYAEAVLEELAAVYADHPDYDTAWA